MLNSGLFGLGGGEVQLRQLPRLLMLLVCLNVGVSQASVDVSGSEDIAELKRYPNSWIAEYSRALVPEYRLALGTMKKVNAVVAPEAVEYIAGELTRITYRIPSGRSSEEAFSWFQRQLESLPHEKLYSCDGRRCGSSNQWANSQFGIARLYGVDREQHYLALRLKQAEEPVIAMYSVRRGNRRVYMHLDIIRTKASAGLLTADELRFRLQRGERVSVSDRDWSEEELSSMASAIGSLLVERPSSDIWLVGHQSRRGPYVRLQNDARALAELLKVSLVGLGIDESRLRTFGVGPLAPAYDPAVPENRIELLVE